MGESEGRAPHGPRWRDWLARFGWAELGGLVGSYAGFIALGLLSGSAVAAAYGAAMGENAMYYGMVFLRDWRAADPKSRTPGRVLGAMAHDFGIAEVLDSLVIRPFATLACTAALGPAPGVGVGKISADAVFYVLAIGFYEWRRAREGRR